MQSGQDQNWYEKLFPECDKGDFKSDYLLLVVTLSKLKLKRTQDAITKGWICIRPACYPRPGEFVHNSQINQLSALCHRVAYYRNPELKTEVDKREISRLQDLFRLNPLAENFKLQEKKKIINRIESGLLGENGLQRIFETKKMVIAVEKILLVIFNMSGLPKYTKSFTRFIEREGQIAIDQLNLQRTQIHKLSQSRRELLVEKSRKMSCQTLINSLRILSEEQRVEESFLRLQSIRPELFQFAAYFTKARMNKRKITAFLGPTNSGKTFRSIQKLKAAKTGVYLAPLRLLALEVFDELERYGCAVSLVTGEERIMPLNSTHTCSTIEMLDTNNKVAVVVIDEVQLLLDSQRGWAWTQAILGACCDDLYICGSEEILPVLEKLACYTGEGLEVIKLERQSKLVPISKSFRLKDLPDHSAIISFSKREILDLKESLESKGKSVSVIYGALSPKVRRQQAKLFREGVTQVLVASDAIGMGLNLPIEYLFFYKLEKYDGNKVRHLTSSEIRQIAGRAGRRLKYPIGYVGIHSPNKSNIKSLTKSLVSAPEEVKNAKVLIAPTVDHIVALSQILETSKLTNIYHWFKRYLTFDQTWFAPLITDEQLTLSEICDDSNLDLLTKYTFSASPVDCRSPMIISGFMSFLNSYSKRKQVPLPFLSEIKKLKINNREDLEYAENLIKLLTLYRWLGFRFPEEFAQIQEADALIEEVDQKIIDALSSGCTYTVCNRCRVKLPKQWMHAMCNRCYRRNRSHRSWYDDEDYNVESL